MQKISLLTTLFFICSLTAFAQINDGSMPKSFTPAFYLNKNIPLVQCLHWIWLPSTMKIQSVMQKVF